jgi:hypothetical protein
VLICVSQGVSIWSADCGLLKPTKHGLRTGLKLMMGMRRLHASGRRVKPRGIIRAEGLSAMTRRQIVAVSQ